MSSQRWNLSKEDGWGREEKRAGRGMGQRIICRAGDALAGTARITRYLRDRPITGQDPDGEA